MLSTMARPRPTPLSSVRTRSVPRWNGSTSVGTSSGSSTGPVFWTVSTAPPGSTSVVIRGVRWDAKYATWDNFTGAPVDGYEVNRIVGSAALAVALLDAQTRAAHRGCGLLLWDAYRPQRAVDRFVAWSTQPEDGRCVAGA
jgi:D-alanyl-D-alanine dipeptidase